MGLLPVALLVMEPDRGLRLAPILRASGFQTVLLPNISEAYQGLKAGKLW